MAKESTISLIQDQTRINKAKNKININLVKIAEKIQAEYQNLFGFFDIHELNELFKVFDKKSWIIKKFVESHKINKQGITPEKWESIIEIPDYSLLLAYIHQFDTAINAYKLSEFIHNISELYSEGEKAFVLKDDSIIMTRIIERYSFEASNKQEELFIKEISELTEIYNKLLNEYKNISINQIPVNILNINILNDGHILLTPEISIFRNFRKSLHKQLFN